MSVSAFAVALDASASRINSVLNDDRAITTYTALRLSRYMRTTTEFWMNLQKHLNYV